MQIPHSLYWHTMPATTYSCLPYPSLLLQQASHSSLYDFCLSTDSVDLSLSQLWEMVKEKEASCAAVPGVTKSRARLSDWTAATGPPCSLSLSLAFNLLSIWDGITLVQIIYHLDSFHFNGMNISCLQDQKLVEEFSRPLSSVQFSSVQLLSCVCLFATPWTAARQASLSITSSQSPPKPMSTESVMPSSHLILYRPLLLLPSIFPSIRVFSNESNLLIRWPKYWNFSFNISPFNGHLGLISFRMDWLDLLAAQGSLKSLLQHHSSKAAILQHSAFFIVQLSHPYMTSGKTIASTRQTFVGKVTSLLFNMLSRLVIVFLPRSKFLLISWLHHHLQWFWSPRKSCHCFHCFPTYLPWSDGTRCHDLQFLNVEF